MIYQLHQSVPAAKARAAESTSFSESFAFFKAKIPGYNFCKLLCIHIVFVTVHA